MIGIIGAMKEELEALLEVLEGDRVDAVGGFVLHAGVLEGRRVLVAQCGIGKVNAAALTQAMILRGVTRVVFTGVAGALAPGLRVGDVVVSSDAVQHDVDVTPLGYEIGQVPDERFAWQADERLRDLALEVASELTDVRVVAGRVLSGDRFVASSEEAARLRDVFGGACVEMEGAAVAQVCARNDVPFVVVRSMSDSADGGAHVDFREFTRLAAARAKTLVRALVRRLDD